MKLAILASLAAQTVHANLGASISAVESAAADADPNSPFKAFSGQIGKTINGLNEYGCWCYLYEDHGRGKGVPVDVIDEMCKTLADGYECTMRDAEDEGTTCIPWEVTYVAAVGGGAAPIDEECATLNAGNNCAIRACIVEGSFVANLLDVFLSGAAIDETLRHSNGFDVATNCPIKISSKAPGEKACCGNYPDRFPYRTTGGDRKKNFYNRQCCGTRTFNANNMKCCNADQSQVKFNC